MVVKFLCDEMLKGLAKWLRVAGYDTLLAADATPDRIILQQAMAGERLLITRDRKLIEHRHADQHVLLLHGNDLDSWVCELNRRLHINWQLAPFSRCAKCNTPLVKASDEMYTRLLDDTQEMLHKSGGICMWCHSCDRLYWEGSHVHRMQQTLQRFHRCCT
jgi:uncharacterized protein with PIN domain